MAGKKNKSGNRPMSLDHLGARQRATPGAPRPGQAAPLPPGRAVPPAPARAAAATPTPTLQPAGPSVPGEYLLHPTAPLVFGTGRPLDFGLGGETLSFPFPATVAGALRAAVQATRGKVPDPFAEPDGLELRWLTLARLRPQVQPLFPRPADAVHLGGRRTRLRPEPVPAGVYTDLPSGLESLVLAPDAGNGKPDEASPWWTADELVQWLAAPDAAPAAAAYPGGDAGPRTAPRTHNVIDPRGKGTIDGGLFRSTGLDFAGRSGYALAVACSARDLDGAARRLGSEGRFARIEAVERLPLRTAPPDVTAALANARRFRCILVTPAVFERGGWCPDWIEERTEAGAQRLRGDWPAQPAPAGDAADGPPAGSAKGSASPAAAEAVAGMRLVAAAITRAQSWSGWQPEGRGTRPGPGRAWRVVPAGSVFWFELPESSGMANPVSLWGRSLCNGRWQREGWGRCVVGVA